MKRSHVILVGGFMTVLVVACIVAVLFGGNAGAKNEAATVVVDDGRLKVDLKPTGGQSIPVAAERPATSEANADLELYRLLAKHTANTPTALDALKTCEVRQTGVMIIGENARFATECVGKFDWPNRFRADWQINTQPKVTKNLFIVRGETVLKNAAGLEGKIDEADTVLQQIVLAEMRATWLLTLVPLADKTARVAMMLPASDDAPGMTLVRVWIGKRPPVVLAIDPKSRLLNDIFFEKTEDGITGIWSFQLKDFKAVQGVLLPHQAIYKAGSRVAAEWTSISYTTPKTFEAATFEKP